MCLCAVISSKIFRKAFIRRPCLRICSIVYSLAIRFSNTLFSVSQKCDYSMSFSAYTQFRRLLSNKWQNENLEPCEIPNGDYMYEKYIITKAQLNGPKAVATSLTTPIFIHSWHKKRRRRKNKYTHAHTE